MDALEKHMLTELYRSVCDPENPARLTAIVAVNSERISRLEVKFDVTAKIAGAITTIGAAAFAAWHRLKGG